MVPSGTWAEAAAGPVVPSGTCARPGPLERGRPAAAMAPGPLVLLGKSLLTRCLCRSPNEALSTVHVALERETHAAWEAEDLLAGQTAAESRTDRRQGSQLSRPRENMEGGAHGSVCDSARSGLKTTFASLTTWECRPRGFVWTTRSCFWT